MVWKDALIRLSGHDLIIDEGELVERTEVEARGHDLGVGSVASLEDVFDDDAVLHCKHHMVAVEPLKVLDRLARIIYEVLRYVQLHEMPNLQLCDPVLRKLDRAELVVATRNPARFYLVLGEADVQEVGPRLNVVAEDVPIGACSQHFVGHCRMPVKKSQSVALTLKLRCEVVFRSLSIA